MKHNIYVYIFTFLSIDTSCTCFLCLSFFLRKLKQWALDRNRITIHVAVYWLVLHQVYSCLSLSIANFYWNHQFWMIQSICVSIGLDRTETKHRKWCTLIFHSIHFKQNETLSNATDILWPFGLSYGSKPYVCYCQFLINLSLSIVSSYMSSCCPKFVFVDGKKHIVCVSISSRGHSF